MNKLNVVNNGAAEIAMNLHYLATEILKVLPEGTGDMFGIGEDDFIMELYPFANLVVRLTDEAYKNGKHFKGVFVYDATEELAACFVAIVERQNAPQMANEMPELDEFELDVLRIIENH